MKPQDLKNKLDQGEDVVLLDIREADEFTAGDALPGAQNVPMGEVLVEAKEGKLPKDKKIITICQSGGRCQILADDLKQKGYDIEYLEGGINEWEKLDDNKA